MKRFENRFKTLFLIGLLIMLSAGLIPNEYPNIALSIFVIGALVLVVSIGKDIKENKNK